MPMVSTIPAIPGSVSVPPIDDKHAKDQRHVDHQRDIGKEPEQAIAREHEQPHRDNADHRRDLARINAVLPQFRADGALFQEVHLRRQGPRPQQHRQLR